VGRANAHGLIKAPDGGGAGDVSQFQLLGAVLMNVVAVDVNAGAVDVLMNAVAVDVLMNAPGSRRAALMNASSSS
jgi:hypothetical protein